MIVKKPSIFIYTHLADEAILREVCAGVEEEGVFYEITEFPDECMEKREQTVPVRLKNSPLNSENVPGKEMCK